MAAAATEAVLATEAGDSGDMDLATLFFLGVFGVVGMGAVGGAGMVGGGGMIEGAIAVPLFQSCVVAGAGTGVGNARSEGALE